MLELFVLLLVFALTATLTKQLTMKVGSLCCGNVTLCRKYGRANFVYESRSNMFEVVHHKLQSAWTTSVLQCGTHSFLHPYTHHTYTVTLAHSHLHIHMQCFGQRLMQVCIYKPFFKNEGCCITICIWLCAKPIMVTMFLRAIFKMIYLIYTASFVLENHYQTYVLLQVCAVVPLSLRAIT